MWKKRFTLAKVILGGVIICAAIPPTLYWTWGHAYAATTSPTVRSVSEIAQKLTGAMNNRRETITFTYEGKTSNLKTQIQTGLDQAMNSDPYLYYIIDSYGYTYRGSKSSVKVTVEVKYLETLEQTAFVNKEVKATLKKIITPGMNNHQKVKAIHDWVVLRLKYDTSYRKYTAYEGLKSGSAVCQGYSLLTYKLLKEAGFSNKIVEGTAKQPGGRSQSHAWNLVLLEGRWYHLDTTWDDPTPDKAGVVSTAYYLKTDAQMRQDHSWTKSYPAASVAYYKTLSALVERGGQSAGVYKQLQKDLNYELYAEERIVRSAADLIQLANKAVASGEGSLLFRYHGSGTQLKNDLQELYKLGLEEVSYSSTSFDNTGDLKVYVTWE
ncbi:MULTISPECIES: transglutaminase domain-containing protein [Paenibacillus]|uniref:transglutaminase domain-containing protein n=1 Tax=Paenibacillus TaxID=44249 RepID=UPI00096E8B13|nr:transglutaminase domain-containing protein [Paenibacillus odorifer]OMD11865.1 transglutaminase [Paenibacillus odorifer]OME00337.1 transglutaminase [Paenibacillus odorifer]